MYKYIISARTHAIALSKARELGIDAKDFCYVQDDGESFMTIRTRLYGLRVEHESQLIGYFSIYEREALMQHLKKPVEYFDFSKALKLIKEGKKVKRKNWGGYWFLSTTGKVYVPNKNELLPFNEMIVACLKDNGGYVPAQPYQEDLLAEDWIEVE